MKPTAQHRAAPSASQTPRWTKEQIRAARMTPIAPYLEKRGLRLIENGADNYTIREYPGLIIKDSYWRWPGRNAGGNTIDLCMQVLRLSFNDAMRELAQMQYTERSTAPEVS